MSLLEKDSSKQGGVSPSLEDMEFDEGDTHDYVVAGVVDSAVFKSDEDGNAGELYYQVHWKGYPNSEDTWEPFDGVSHLRKLLGRFHKENPDKPTAESVAAAGRRPQQRTLKRPAPTGKGKERRV